MLGRSIGLLEEDLLDLNNWAASTRFDEKDKSVLRYTDSLCRDNRVDDALYAELERHFDSAEIFKLSVTVGMAGMVNRVHATFLTEVDEQTAETVGDSEFCPLHQPAA